MYTVYNRLARTETRDVSIEQAVAMTGMTRKLIRDNIRNYGLARTHEWYVVETGFFNTVYRTWDNFKARNPDKVPYYKVVNLGTNEVFEVFGTNALSELVDVKTNRIVRAKVKAPCILNNFRITSPWDPEPTGELVQYSL